MTLSAPGSYLKCTLLLELVYSKYAPGAVCPSNNANHVVQEQQYGPGPASRGPYVEAKILKKKKKKKKAIKQCGVEIKM